jgi:ferredoxin-thioredoxin reductase catalytic subunit
MGCQLNRQIVVELSPGSVFNNNRSVKKQVIENCQQAKYEYGSPEPKCLIKKNAKQKVQQISNR